MRKEQFEAFLKTNEKRIYRYLYSLCGNEQDALDVLQNVFVALYQNLDRVDEATALAYSYKIAHNKGLTFIKQKSRYVTHDPADFTNIPDIASPNSEPDHKALHRAVAELPPRLASVIQLQYYDGLSYKEISAALGISVKAVETLLVRAKRILRKKIMQETRGR